MQGDYIQTIEEIFTKATVGQHVFAALIGGGASAATVGFKLEDFGCIDNGYNCTFVYTNGQSVDGDSEVPDGVYQGFDIPVADISGATQADLLDAVSIDVTAVKNGVITEVNGATDDELIAGKINIDLSELGLDPTLVEVTLATFKAGLQAGNSPLFLDCPPRM